MIQHARFNVFETPRTASTFVRKALMAQLGPLNITYGTQHKPRSHFRKHEAADKPAVGFIREDSKEWVASIHRYAMKNKKHVSVMKIYRPLFTEWSLQWNDEFEIFYSNLEKSGLIESTLATYKQGLDFCGTTEKIYESLINALEFVGIPPKPELWPKELVNSYKKEFPPGFDREQLKLTYPNPKD